MIWLILIIVVGCAVLFWCLVSWAAGKASEMDSECDAIYPERKREDIGWIILVVAAILIWAFILWI